MLLRSRTRVAHRRVLSTADPEVAADGATALAGWTGCSDASRANASGPGRGRATDMGRPLRTASRTIVARQLAQIAHTIRMTAHICRNVTAAMTATRCDFQQRWAQTTPPQRPPRRPPRRPETDRSNYGSEGCRFESCRARQQNYRSRAMREPNKLYDSLPALGWTAILTATELSPRPAHDPCHSPRPAAP